MLSPAFLTPFSLWYFHPKNSCVRHEGWVGMQNTAPVTALSLIHNLICELADDQLIEQEEGMLGWWDGGVGGAGWSLLHAMGAIARHTDYKATGHDLPVIHILRSKRRTARKMVHASYASRICRC